MRLLLLLATPLLISAQITIPTEGYDNTHRNWNSSETTLTTSNVAPGKFGLLATYALDGYAYSEPLYVPRIGGKNLWLVATNAQSIYAFDADKPGAVVWQWNSGQSTYSPPTNLFYSLPVGCGLGTPAVDVAQGWIFTDCPNGNNRTLFKVSLSAGTTIASVDPSAGVSVASTLTSGQDPCANGTTLTFCAQRREMRLPIRIANGKLYIAYGAYGDGDSSYHSWVLGFNESNLALVGSWCSTPNSSGGAIWRPFAIAANGDIYATTGNAGPIGPGFDGVTEYAMSLVRLSGSNLSLVDYGTPSNWSSLSAADADVASGGVISIPSPALILTGWKDFNAYLFAANCLGHLGFAQNGCSVQIVPVATGSVNSGSGIFHIAFANNVAYFTLAAGKVCSLPLSGTTLGTTPTCTAGTYSTHGLMTAVSSNGSSGVIVWGLSPNAGDFTTAQTGTLRALSADLSTEYYNSGTVSSDNLGVIPKFVTPVEGNGRVAVNTGTTFCLFGLRTSVLTGGNVQISGKASH
jgi:hypothetical protein